MKFEKALEQRREEVRQQRYRALEQQRKRIKKEKRKETILMIFIVIGFIIALGLAMKIGQDSVESCTKAGHSQQYCEKGL